MQSFTQTWRPLPHLRRCLSKALQSHPPARESTQAVAVPLQNCIALAVGAHTALLALRHHLQGRGMCRNGGGTPPECSMTAVDGVDGSKPSTPTVTYRDMFLRWIWLGCVCPRHYLVRAQLRAFSRADAQRKPRCVRCRWVGFGGPTAHIALFQKVRSATSQSCSATRLRRSVACVL